MSKRRTAGEIVIKRENAGFLGERVRVQIMPEEEVRVINGVDVDCREWCFAHDDCTDQACREWANLAVLNEDNSIRGYCYHVSECEMEDVTVP